MIKLFFVLLFLLVPSGSWATYAVYSCTPMPLAVSKDVYISFNVLTSSNVISIYVSTVYESRYTPVVAAQQFPLIMKSKTDIFGVSSFSVNTPGTVTNSATSITCVVVPDTSTLFVENTLLGLAGIVCGGLVAFAIARAVIR